MRGYDCFPYVCGYLVLLWFCRGANEEDIRVVTLGVPMKVSGFARVESGGCCCISGAGLVCRLLRSPKARIAVVAEPHEFKGALTVDVLRDFFSVEGTSGILFRNLSVVSRRDLYRR